YSCGFQIASLPEPRGVSGSMKIGRIILIAVSESCCSPAKEDRLTGAEFGAWTQHSFANLSRISGNCSVELKKIPDNSVEWGVSIAVFTRHLTNTLKVLHSRQYKASQESIQHINHYRQPDVSS